MNKFGERLKELRTEKGLSLQQLADKVGITPAGLNYWEQNKRVPNLDAVIALADFFDVTLDYIAGRED